MDLLTLASLKKSANSSNNNNNSNNENVSVFPLMITITETIDDDDIYFTFTNAHAIFNIFDRIAYNLELAPYFIPLFHEYVVDGVDDGEYIYADRYQPGSMQINSIDGKISIGYTSDTDWGNFFYDRETKSIFVLDASSGHSYTINESMITSDDTFIISVSLK